MPVRNACQRPGFTLVELLVVITIIGILVTLVSVAGYRALIAVRQWTISTEVNALENAISVYKEKQQDFPPDFSNNALVHSHLRKVYPRHRETVANINAAIANLDPSEALVFWLGGTQGTGFGLYDNPEFPITNNGIAGGQMKKFHDFDKTRLIDLDGDGKMSFVPAYGTPRAPYVYFDSRSYAVAVFPATTPAAQNALRATMGIACPYKTDAPKVNTPFTAANTFNEWESAETFQIVSAGLDGHYGTWASGPTMPAVQNTPRKYYPSGVVNDPLATDGNRGNTGIAYTRQDRDNVTSFAEGPLEARLP